MQQCVQFYYLTKKKEKYKVIVNAVREERKRRGLPRAAQDSPTTPVGPLLAADSKGARLGCVCVCVCVCVCACACVRACVRL